MARCRRGRWPALGLLATMLPGCVTGHLFAAARRRERPVTIMAAGVEPGHLVVAYTAEVTDDDGALLGTVARAAAVPWAAVTAPVSPAADAVTVTWVEPTRVATDDVVAVDRTGHSQGPAVYVATRDGVDDTLVWHDGAGSAHAPLPLNALTRQRTEPWVWPLVPVALLGDAVIMPVLVLLWPSTLVTGD